MEHARHVLQKKADLRTPPRLSRRQAPHRTPCTQRALEISESPCHARRIIIPPSYRRMRRNWIQFNTRGPRACRQAHCLLLARLASPPYHLSDLCLCAPGCCVCVSGARALCSRACEWLEKPEPLLEFGHDLAVTHRNRERGRKREATAAAQTLEEKKKKKKERKKKTSERCDTSERERAAGLKAVCRSSAQQLPPGAAAAVY